jgi:hypothetical protein
MQISSPVLRSSPLLLALCLYGWPLGAQVLQQFPIQTSQTQRGGDPSNLVTTTEHLTGVVVSSFDGAPVARALVTSADQRFAAFTDSQGRFSFDLRRTVPAGSSPDLSTFPQPVATAPSSVTLYLNVHKPGYVFGTLNFPLPALQPSSSEPPLTLKLVPTGVISGRVYPESGDLPDGLFVQLLRKQIINGTANWLPANGVTTNSHGEFRIAHLDPADYKLFIPAYIPESDAKAAHSASVPGFVATYYPNAAKVDSAAILPIGPGASLSADLTLRAAPFYQITVPVVGLPAQSGLQAVLLDGAPGLRLESKDQTIEGYLPAGTYEMLLESAQPRTNTNQNPQLSIASVHLEVGDKLVRLQPVALHPAPEIPVIVRREFSSGQPQPAPAPNQPSVYLFLQNVHQELGLPAPSIKSNTGDEGLALAGALPGTYTVAASPRGLAYIASITSGTTDLLREPLQIVANSDPRPIEVTLRDDFASIDATTTGDPAGPLASRDNPTFVLCIPLDRPLAMPGISFAQQSQVSVRNLAPGHYLVLAARAQSVQSFEYNNPEVLRGLMQKGVVVTLGPDEKATVQVPFMTDGEN